MYTCILYNYTCIQLQMSSCIPDFNVLETPELLQALQSYTGCLANESSNFGNITSEKLRAKLKQLNTSVLPMLHSILVSLSSVSLFYSTHAYIACNIHVYSIAYLAHSFIAHSLYKLYIAYPSYASIFYVLLFPF